VIGKIAPFAVSSLLSGVAGLLSILLFSRLLSAEAYGYYVTLLALAALGQTAGFNWLQASVIRLHPEETDEAGRAQLAAALRLGFGLSAVIISMAWAVGYVALARSSGGAVLGIAGLSVLLFRAWASVGQSWSRVMQRPWRFAAAQAMQALGGLALALAGLAWRPGDPLVPLAAMAIASLLASLMTPLAGAGTFGGWRRSGSRLRQMWSYGGPITAVSIGFAVLAASDRLLIASILGPAAAGAYAAASGIASRAIGLLLVPIAAATKPQVFIEFNRGGAGPAGQLLKSMSGWLIAVGLPMAVLLACAPSALTSAIICRELADAAAVVLPWMAAGALLSGLLTLHFQSGFQITHRTKWMLLAVAPAAAFNVVFNVLLLPRFGILAAGWSMVASYAVALVLTIRFGSRHFRVPFSVSDALRTAAACVPLGVFLQLEFRQTMGSLALMLGGGALIYAASALALNVAGSRIYLMRWLRNLAATQPLA
jgi:O-antigen/teichoic acid export membrane protein